MGCRPALTGQIGRLSGIGKGADQDVGAERAGSPAVGKEPARIAVRLPHLAQTVMDRPRQRHEAFLVALAEDPQEPLILSMAVTSSVAASLIRRPQA